MHFVETNIQNVYMLQLVWKKYIPLCVYLVHIHSKWILIDTGAPEHVHDVIAALKNAPFLNAKLDGIFITHGHVDHSGGLYGILMDREICSQDTKLYLHEAELVFIVEKGYEVLARDSQNVYFRWLMKLGLFADLSKEYRNKMRSILYTENGGIANRVQFVEHGDRWMKDCIEIVHTPGHTPGHIGVLVKEYKVLFAGDTAMKLKWVPCCRSRLSKSFVLSTPNVSDAEQSLTLLLDIAVSQSIDFAFLAHQDSLEPISIQDIRQKLSLL